MSGEAGASKAGEVAWVTPWTIAARPLNRHEAIANAAAMAVWWS